MECPSILSSGVTVETKKLYLWIIFNIKEMHATYLLEKWDAKSVEKMHVQKFTLSLTMPL